METLNKPTLNTFLIAQNYVAIPLQIIPTNHLLLFAKVNGYEGLFILDTGASQTCLHYEYTENLGLTIESTDEKAIGVGGQGIDKADALAEIFQMGDWHQTHTNMVSLDLSHVVHALRNIAGLEVHGIVGADILRDYQGIIDYATNTLYLKKEAQKDMSDEPKMPKSTEEPSTEN